MLRHPGSSWGFGSSTQMFGADTAAVRLSRTCSPALVQGCVVQGRHHGLTYPLCALRQGQPQCLFPIHDQIQSDCSSEGRDGRKFCKFSKTEQCLNKALFHVLLTCIYLFIVMVTFIYSFTHLFMFPFVVSK
uniref:Uncharacterized protein n=1 Tax=Cyprinus carpio carpio TaxID=630221 RepID=A0A9J8BEH6_CYPCA